MPSILHQFTVDAPARKVFETIATPSGLNSWWTLKSNGEPERGCVYTFYFGAEYDWRAEVIELEADKKIVWRMTEAMDDWLPTRIKFILVEDAGKTTVRFSHQGWKTASEHFSISSFCWGSLLNAMKDYVETGAIVPFEKRS